MSDPLGEAKASWLPAAEDLFLHVGCEEGELQDAPLVQDLW